MATKVTTLPDAKWRVGKYHDFWAQVLVIDRQTGKGEVWKLEADDLSGSKSMQTKRNLCQKIGLMKNLKVKTRVQDGELYIQAFSKGYVDPSEFEAGDEAP